MFLFVSRKTPAQATFLLPPFAPPPIPSTYLQKNKLVAKYAPTDSLNIPAPTETVDNMIMKVNAPTRIR